MSKTRVMIRDKEQSIKGCRLYGRQGRLPSLEAIVGNLECPTNPH